MSMILISGKQGSGKTTTAEAVITELKLRGEDARRITLARPLKVMEAMIWDYLTDFYDLQRPEKDGRLLQLLGTEWGRKTLGDNIWVDLAKIAMETEEMQIPQGAPVRDIVFVMDDARFPNEFDAFPDALRVRLECPEETRKARATGWRDDVNHASEVGLDAYSSQGRFDKVFWTNGADGTAEISVQIVNAFYAKKAEKFGSKA